MFRQRIGGRACTEIDGQSLSFIIIDFDSLNKTPVAFFVVVDKGYFEKGCQVGCFNLKSLGSLTQKENGQILKYLFLNFP